MDILENKTPVTAGLMGIRGGISTHDMNEEIWPTEGRYANGCRADQILEYLEDASSAYGITLVKMNRPERDVTTGDIAGKVQAGEIIFVEAWGGALVIGKGIGACIVKAVMSIIDEAPYDEEDEDYDDEDDEDYDDWDEEDGDEQ